MLAANKELYGQQNHLVLRKSLSSLLCSSVLVAVYKISSFNTITTYFLQYYHSYILIVNSMFTLLYNVMDNNNLAVSCIFYLYKKKKKKGRERKNFG